MVLLRVQQAFKGFKNPLCHRCSPTLLFTETHSTNPPVFNNDCALVLAALGDEGWKGRWALNSRESAELLSSIEADSGKRWDVDEKLTLDEILNFARKETNREKLLELPNAVHGLLNDTMITEAFRRFDIDGSGHLNIAEWNDFLNRLEYLHLKYLLRVAFHNFRAYFGRGREWHLHARGNAIEQDLENAGGSACIAFNGEYDSFVHRATVQVGRDPDLEKFNHNPFPCGWWEDFCYYSANNHPLHGIFACDPIHPLSWIERLAMELATIGFSYFTAALHRSWVDDRQAPVVFLANPIVFSLVMVTIPGMIMWWTFFLLFACKCGQVDKARAGEVQIRNAKMLRCAGATIAYILCILGISALVWQSVIGLDFYLIVVKGRLQSYVIFWLLMAFVYFNPIVAWGTPDPSKSQSGLGDLIGLGQWRIEKQRFQARCLQALEYRRVQIAQESLITPDSDPSPHFGVGMKNPAQALLGEVANEFYKHPFYVRAKETAEAVRAHHVFMCAKEATEAAQAHPVFMRAKEAAEAAQAHPAFVRAKEAKEAAQALLADEKQNQRLVSGVHNTAHNLFERVSIVAQNTAQATQALLPVDEQFGQGFLSNTKNSTRVLFGEGYSENRGYQLVASQQD